MQHLNASSALVACILAVGAVVGFGLVFGGGGAIVWNEKIDEFPYRKGLVTIFMSCKSTLHS